MKGVSIAMDKKESTSKLVEQLDGIINYEVKKPYTEMDADLVEACVELILELQGKNYTLSTEELEEKVRKIPFVDTKETKKAAQKKIKTNKRKILLIAAIIAMLCTLLMVMSSGRFVDYWHSVMNDKFGSVFNVPVGEEYNEGNKEFIHNGESIIYEDIESFFKYEDYDVLLPNELPEGIELTDIQVVKNDNLIFASFNSVITSYKIHLDTPLPQMIKDNVKDTIIINSHTCYISSFDDVNSVQIYFEDNGNYYKICGADEQILLGIIENLEEY